MRFDMGVIRDEAVAPSRSSIVEAGPFLQGSGHALTIGLAVLFTFFIHEVTHWLAGELLGNRMGMTLNAAWPLSGNYLQRWHATAVSAVGPLITMLQAALAFMMFRRMPMRWIYPFLLTPAVMRILALCMNLINPQDEGRISLSLGIGLLTLPILVCAVLVSLVVKASRREKLSGRYNAFSIVLIVVFSSALILLSQK